ncbi:MAG: phenylalanine--tRNA ligase subunit beta [Gammaproteobacteria bacterium]|nr:phenylalanine--tRNA ligase subunit beta [Gammaproteobacteria bacterium]
MKVSLRWLKEFVAVPTDDPAELAEVLASLGHEVEGYQRLEAAFSGVVVGRVEQIERHPDADRLRFCQVSVGGVPQDIVCGADNFDVGAIVPVSVPGAVLAGGLHVEVRTIRGVRSHGMICSEAELGLGEGREGIMVLDPSTPVGTDFSTLVPYPDVIFDLSITPNRGDAMSILGIARDLAAYYRLDLSVPAAELQERGEASAVSIVLEDPVGCPRYVGREVREVTVSDSPLGMRLRLRDAGIRSINNVVDITNYVLLEYGQPLHGFDLDTIAEETIVVRRGRYGEDLRTLDGVKHEITPEDLLITDPERVIAFAGVMGGEETEVGPTTRRVLIEAAHFDAPTVMNTAQRHGLRTEASSRFERGVDPDLPARAAARAAHLLAQLAGGVPAPGSKDAYPSPIPERTVRLSLAEPGRLLGVSLAREEIVDLLERLGFGVRGEDPLDVTVPTYRPDVSRPADLVEEIARLYGLNHIPSRLPHGPGSGLGGTARRARTLRAALVGAGLWEASTLTFLAPEDLEKLHADAATAIRVRNPLREEESLLRTTLLPGLLKSVRFNASHGLPSVALFETGKVFIDTPDHVDPKIPFQPDTLAFVISGRFGAKTLGGESRPADFGTAGAVWKVIETAMGLEAEVRAEQLAGFHPGRAGRVFLDEHPIGAFGELHPAVTRAYGIEGRVAAGEFRLERLLETHGFWTFKEPSTYPPVVFDLAFEVHETVPSAELVKVIRDAAGPMLETVHLFDEFRGGSLPEGHKSLAVQLTFRSPDTTLTNEDVREDRGRIITAVADKLGGRLRGGA